MARLTDATTVVQNRRAARYRLAQLLTDEEFEQAAELAHRWFEQGIIEGEDQAFVEGIIRAAGQ